MWPDSICYELYITLATLGCSGGLTFASGALSTTAGDLHERVFPQFTSSRSHGRRHFPIPSLSGFEVTKPRFSSFNNDSYAKVDAAETRESTSPRVGNLQDEAAVSGESWIDPPPVEYSYPLEDYLVIPNTRRYCEGSTILLATSAKNSKYKDSVDARVACSSSQNCVFASSSAAKRIGLPLPTTFQDDLLPGTGTTWFCSGSEWFRGTKAFGWVTLVKGEALRAGCPDFDLHLNTITSGCEGSELLSEFPRIGSMDHASRLCQEDAGCAFFRIDFGQGEDVPNRVRQPKALLCTGVPSAWEQQDGVVTAMRRDLSAEVKGESVLLTPVKKIRRGKKREGSGSLTADDLFDSVPRGTLVPATLIDLISGQSI